MIYTTGTVDNAIATLFAHCFVHVPVTNSGSDDQNEQQMA